MTPYAEVEILGVPIAALTFVEAVELLVAQIPFSRPYVVFTPNPEMIDRSCRDRDFRKMLKTAHLLLPDGIGVVWASRLLASSPLRETVPGVDVMEALLHAGAENGWSVFFLGTTPESLELAVDRAEMKFPGLKICGYHHGYLAADDEDAVIEKINEAQPHITISGMGIPRDQRFLSNHRAALPPGLYLAIGGGLDILAGTTKRAPDWIRRCHCEWLYRLLSSPSRWRRQLALPRFVMRVLRKRLAL